MKFKITDRHKVPTSNLGVPLKYPFDEIQVGQSFSVSEEEMLSARRAAHQYGVRHGKKFATRGTRIWRTV